MFELVLINKYIIKVVLSYFEYIIYYIISLYVFRNNSANLLLTALAMLLLVVLLYLVF